MFTDLKIRAWALDVMLFTRSLVRISPHRMARSGSTLRKCYVDRSYGSTNKTSNASESTSMVL